MTDDIPRRRELTLDDYEAGVRGRDVAVLARALTLIESNHAAHQQAAESLLTRLLPETGQAIRIGMTGAPGVGKSTFIESLGLMLVEAGRRPAVLAVDPSSDVSGGSILGDKTRMTKLSSRTEAYIRPSPSAGTLGGVARKTRESLMVCEAAGYDVVIVETVGVGQSETMVAGMTDCFVVLMLPGAGDDLQGIKRGLLELVDVMAVNKADGGMREAANVAARQYGTALQTLLGRRQDVPPVLTCSARENNGVDAVWEAIERRFENMKESGELADRRRRQGIRWMWSLVDGGLSQRLREHPDVLAVRDELERDVLSGELPPEVAARRILDAFGLDPT